MSKTKNGIGWQVEIYTKQLGWKPLSLPYETKEAAEHDMENMYIETDRKNLRVYEALS